MSRSALAVGVIAVLSVVTSVVTLAVASATGHGLHISIVNVAVIAGAAAIMSVLLHERTPENNLWRVLLASAVMGPVAVVLLAAMEAQPISATGPARVRLAARRAAHPDLGALLRALPRRASSGQVVVRRRRARSDVSCRDQH